MARIILSNRDKIDVVEEIDYIYELLKTNTFIELTERQSFSSFGEFLEETRYENVKIIVGTAHICYVC